MKKLSVLLGLREKLEKDFTNMLNDMLSKFTNKQGLFGGFKNTYVPLEGFSDDETKRGFLNVESTVEDQLKWLKDHTADYLETVFSIEKTNAQNVTAELVVKGESWGKYTTLELLRLKGILDGKLKSIIAELPIRSEKHIWKQSEQEEFTGRKIWETPIEEGFNRTTIMDTIIINDPHIKDAPNRPPVTRETKTQVNVGSFTKQTYSGAITNLEKAQMVVRLNDVLKGVVEALETANDVPVQTSTLGTNVLTYLFK